MHLPYFKKSIQKYIENPRIVYIPNAIPQFARKAYDNKDKGTYTILNVGRINPKQKRQHLLVEGFAQIASRYPEWTLKIWGGNKGRYVEKMKKFIRKKMDNRIMFMGKTHQIEDEYYKADIFCFPSSYEGFPNALGEAMAIGLPSIVCRDCASCMSIIQDGLTGLIAEPSAKSIAGALKILMDNKEKRCSIGEKARLSISAYQPQIVYKMWDDLLMQLCQKSE